MDDTEATSLEQIQAFLAGSLDLRARPCAEDLPRSSRVYALAVHPHPRGDALQDRHLLVIGHAAVWQREVEKEIAVAADNVHQHIDHALRSLVSRPRIVVPVADAGIGLDMKRGGSG